MSFVHTELASSYVDKGGVFVLGRSLGGAVSARAIASLEKEQLNHIDGLILENTFTSIVDMASDMFGPFAIPIV